MSTAQPGQRHRPRRHGAAAAELAAQADAAGALGGGHRGRRIEAVVGDDAVGQAHRLEQRQRALVALGGRG